MSSKSKGRRSVKSCIELLEKEGWLVDEVELGGRFRRDKDLFSGSCLTCFGKSNDCGHDDKYRFNGFDLIAIKNGVVAFIQVKTNTPPLLWQYKLFAKRYASRYIHIVSYTKIDRKGFVKHRFYKSGTIKKTRIKQ